MTATGAGEITGPRAGATANHEQCGKAVPTKSGYALHSRIKEPSSQKRRGLLDKSLSERSPIPMTICLWGHSYVSLRPANYQEPTLVPAWQKESLAAIGNQAQRLPRIQHRSRYPQR